MDKWKWWLLGGIVVLAAVLRLTWLDKYPAGFTPDEAAFGYNAYSLLQTGRDEWGIPFWQLPFTNLRSFGDYKMPLYAFLTVPSVALFGLNEFAVRFPNALLGTLAVVIIYFIPLSLIKRGGQPAHWQAGGEFVGIASALLLSISPWHMPLSRGAFEANLITLLLPLAIVLFFKHIYLLSSIFYALTFYSYHSAKLITPLSFFGLFFIFRVKPTRKITRPLVVFMVLFLPAFYSLLFSNSRAAEVSIFNPGSALTEMSKSRLRLIQSGWSPFRARLVENKYIYIGTTFIKNYFSYFASKYLFSEGPAESTYGMIPGWGVLNWVQLPFLLVFIFQAYKTRNLSSKYLLFLLLISPLPAALTKGPGYAANRAAMMVIPLTIMTALGFIQTLKLIKTKSLKRLISLISLLFLICGLGMYTKVFIQKSPALHSGGMGYGYRQLTEYLVSCMDKYGEIRISRTLSEAHIYFAFYSHYPPRIYQTHSPAWSDFEKLGFSFLDQYDGYHIGKIRFGDLNYQRRDKGNILYVGRPDDFPDTAVKAVISTYPDSSPAIVSVTQNP